MFAPVTKAQFAGPDPGAAIATALAHPRRPVYLEVATDALSAPASAAAEPPAVAVAEPRDLEPALALLDRAQRPLVWAGGGATRDGAGAAVAALAERLAAPVFTSYQASGLLGDHPLAVGLPTHVPETGALWDQADLVVAVGSDLDGVNTQNWRQPQPPALVAVNVDPADAAKNYRADVVVCAGAAAGADALARGASAHGPWADVDAVRASARARLEREHPDEMAFLAAFARAVPPEAVVVCDMCIPGYWIGGFHRFAAPRRLVYPLGWGTLGAAFPQALGVSLSGAGPVVSVSGDGGFLYACGELATMAQERPAVHRGHRRRRRLRDAALRPAPPRARDLRRRSLDPRLRGACAVLRRARRARRGAHRQLRRRAGPPPRRPGAERARHERGAAAAADDVAALVPARLIQTGSDDVHVSLTRVKTSDQPIDNARIVGEELARWLRDIDGFEGILMLSRPGTSLGLTFWASREVAESHLPARRRFIERMTGVADVEIEEIVDYEVMLADFGPHLAAGESG